MTQFGTVALLMLLIALGAAQQQPKQQQQQQPKQQQQQQPQPQQLPQQSQPQQLQQPQSQQHKQKQDPKCLLPKEPGPCRMNLDRFYYNSQTNACEPFKFGGCRGNDNKFGFLKTCEDACLLGVKKSVNGATAAPVTNAKPSTVTTTPPALAAATTTKAPAVPASAVNTQSKVKTA